MLALSQLLGPVAVARLGLDYPIERRLLSRFEHDLIEIA